MKRFKRGVKTHPAFSRGVKKEIRIIGWDDSRHSHTDKSVVLVGPIFRGAEYMDGMLSVSIKKDGLDSTQKIASAIRKSRHYGQLSVIMTDGITFGGFNLVDIKALHIKTGLPVIAVQRYEPNMKEFLGAIRKVFKKDWRKRVAIVKKTGKVKRWEKDGRAVFYQSAGLTDAEVSEILDLTILRGNTPEPLRVAHLIAGGLSGESRGGA